jgi:hypothetical protein
MENIGIAFLAIANQAHDWASDLASEDGHYYDDVVDYCGPNNRYYREAIRAMQWQASDASRQIIPADFEIEF